MKKTFQLITLIFSIALFSQVTIGKNAAPTNDSVILEFGTDGDKGIILPYTSGEIADAVPGTFIFDAVENRVKFMTKTGWFDLSEIDGASDLSAQDTLTENTDAKVIIGATTSDADGILVLESSDKAMVLPIVNEYTDVINPSPGMLVYVKTNQRLAVFNGSNWTFWEP